MFQAQDSVAQAIEIVETAPEGGVDGLVIALGVFLFAAGVFFFMTRTPKNRRSPEDIPRPRSGPRETSYDEGEGIEGG